MTEQENRMYAVSLMNRAGLHFDVRDVATVGRVVAVVEQDLATWLSTQLTGIVSRERILIAIRTGLHRPDQPQPIVAVESNLR